MTNSKRVSFGLVCMSLGLASCGGQPSADDAADIETLQAALGSSSAGTPVTNFFIPTPDPSAVRQVASLLKAHDLRNAARLAAMVTTPQAVWFTGGTPGEVEKAVKRTMSEAALQKRVPVLVAYNVPYRDCAQYSSGGATDTAAYE